MELDRHFLGFIASFGEWIWGFKAVKIIVYVVVGLLVGFVTLIVIGFTRALKKSKRKRRRSTRYSPPRY